MLMVRSRAVRGDPSSWEIHLVEFAVSRQRAGTIFELQSIDVNRTVRGLRCNELVEGIPRHSLDIVVVFGNLADHCT
jgi:hypothetical protein